MNPAERTQQEIGDIALDVLRREDREGQQGWSRAFPWLFAAAKNGVRKNAARFSEADMEDLAKDAVVQVIQKFRDGEICHSGGTFGDLLGITHQTAWCRSVDAFRKHVRRKTELSGEPIEPDSHKPQVPIPVSHTKHSLEDILVAVNELPPPQPEMFLARFLHGFSLEEIAETYQRSYANVSQMFSRMTRTLKARLERQGGLP